METKNHTIHSDPSQEDSKLERQQYLLKPVLLILAGPGFIYGVLIFYLWFRGNVPTIGAILGAGIMFFCFLAFLMNAIGRTRTSSYLSVLALFLIIYGGSYYFGISHALVIGYAIVAVLAGMLIDVISALFFALISMIAYFIVSQAQQSGVLPAEFPLQTTGVSDAIGLVFGISTIVIILWFFERQMIKIIKRDREQNAIIEEANKQLTHELAERRRAEKSLKRNLEFEETTTLISSRFVGAADIDAAITNSIGDMVFLCGADCGLLYTFQKDRKSLKQSYEWHADDKRFEEKDLGDTVVFDTVSKWSDRLGRGKVVRFDKSSQILFNAQSIKNEGTLPEISSMIILPVQIADELDGIILLLNTINTRDWKEEDYTRTSVFSEIIGRSLTRRKLENQLLHSQKMEAVGRLAGGVAHDFNNILTAIMGYSHLALGSLSQDHPASKEMSDITHAAERAAALTNQLLAFSRQQILKPEILNLNALISDMEKMIQRLIGEDIEITTALDPELGNVEADRVQMEQVILNLAVNARDAMPRGGQLTFETKTLAHEGDYTLKHHGISRGRHVMVAVSDTGSGIDKKTQSHIFEPFFTTKGIDRGTGLGLATVYGIIKQSHGKINVYSEPEKGTSFKIYLPEIDKKVKKDSAPPAAAEPQKGTETILAVEDNEIVRALIERSLTSFEYKVLPAAHPDEAIQICEGHDGPIDLMVADVVMPRMSGRELADKLSASRPEMKVLYMSGFTDKAIVHQGILDANVAFLQKPFSPQDLARKIRDVIDQPLIDN